MVATGVYLNIGPGGSLPHFVNVSANPDADVRHDVSNGLPFDDNSVDGVFGEHLLERMTQAQGLALLRECRRVLKPGGIARVATADLDALVQRYGASDWRGDGEPFQPEWHWVDSRCEMMNIGMRERGYQWVYDEDELCLAAERAGFSVKGRRQRGQSDLEHFRDLESDPSATLVMEFAKPTRETSPEPLVSLLIPAYKPRFFEQALKSALEQTYGNLEISIFDDCRGPEIESIATRLAAGDPRVTYERNRETLGGLGNYLRCFEGARGPYIKFLNDDDVLAPTCVERMVAILRSEPNVTLVTSRRQSIDEQGHALPDNNYTQKVADSDCVFEGVSYGACLLKYGNCVGEPTTTLFRKEDASWIRPHFMSFGGEHLLRGCADCATWMNLLGRGDLAYLSDTLSQFRVHSGQRQLEPQIAAVKHLSFAALGFHGRRLGFFEHTRPPTVKVRAPGSAYWTKQRFKWVPLVDVKGTYRAVRTRAVRMLPESIREPLRRVKRRS